MERVIFEDGKLFVDGRAYVSTENQTLVQRIMNADNIYSTQIILNRYDVKPELLAKLSGKYWMRASILDRVNHKDCTIKTNRVASL